MKRFLIGAVCLALTWTMAAEGREVTAQSPSVADIQAAADQLGEHGGVVLVPAGRAEAIGTVTLRPGVSLIGAGPDRTTLFRGPATDRADKAPIIRLVGSEGEGRTRISGLNLVGVKDPESNSWDTGIDIRDGRNFRVDHCRIERFGLGGVHVRGEIQGVIDHCLFVDNFKKAINNVGYGVVVYGPNDWRDDLQFGSSEAVFIEDCEFIGSRHAVASNGGAYYVFRHNHVHGNDNSQAVDAHGIGYGSKRGTQMFEVYENLIEKPVGGSTAMVMRGGSGVIFNNTIRDYEIAIMLTLDFDKKIDWSGPYPIQDQIHNVWVWNNTLDGDPVEPTVPGRSQPYIQEGRDYHTRPKAGYEPFPYPHPMTQE